MAKDFDVVVVGEVNADLVLQGDVTPVFGQVEKLVDDATLTIGSSSAIFACGAARLGLRVAFIGVVGEDTFGRFMVASLQDRGIDTRGIIIDPALKTGLTVILSRGQDRAILTHMGAIGALRAIDIDMDIIACARHLHMGSYYMLDALRPDAPQLFAQAKALGLTVSLDTNYDPTERWEGGIADTLAQADIFFPNEVELTAIAHDPNWRQAMVKLSAVTPLVVVKRGAEGAAARTGGVEFSIQPAPLTAIDTTGAGDSFDAGFVYGYLAGWDISRSLQLAGACGALSTQAAGGTKAQPTLTEALAYIERG